VQGEANKKSATLPQTHRRTSPPLTQPLRLSFIQIRGKNGAPDFSSNAKKQSSSFGPQPSQ